MALPVSSEKTAELYAQRDGEAVVLPIQKQGEGQEEAIAEQADAATDEAVTDESSSEAAASEVLAGESPEATEPGEETEQGEEVESGNADAVTEPTDPTHDELLAEHLRVITEAHADVQVAAARLAGAKESAKYAREAWEQAVAVLNSAIANPPKRLPLFDGLDKPAAVSASAIGDDEPAAETATAKPAKPAVNQDAWRAAEIGVLDLSNSLVSKLAEAGIETIGQLEDVRASYDGLKGIKGIGKKKVDQIEDAVINWLSKNRDAEILAASQEASDSAEQSADSTAEDASQAVNSTEAINELSAKILLEKEWQAMHSSELLARSSGMDAFRKGLEIVCCPYSVKEEMSLAIGWLRGWLIAQHEEEKETWILADRIKEIREEGDWDELHEDGFPLDNIYHAGVDAFDNGKTWSDCPYTGNAGNDWLRGWLMGEQEAKTHNEYFAAEADDDQEEDEADD